jgi:NADH dehydrogenase FAD-containing subunit
MLHDRRQSLIEAGGELRFKRILVLGAGFAGLWSAVGAARALDEHGIGADQVEVTPATTQPLT